MVFCSNCGKENIDDSKFCNECGSRLGGKENEYKNPYKIVLLNFLIAGLGFICLKNRTKAFDAFILVSICAILTFSIHSPISLILALILLIIMSVNETRKYNEKIN